MNIPFFSSRKNSSGPPQSRENSTDANPAEQIIAYHEETKHHYHRFARSLGYLDWDSQPNPFRRFPGTPVHLLPLLPRQDEPSYDDLFVPGRVHPQNLNETTLSKLFRNSLAISAWKRYETAHWALRVNPSSGNLHPTEGYAILGPSLEKMPSGVYHYAPREHAVEQRAQYREGMFEMLAGSFPPGCFFAGLSSIHWREAWKYGERAFRYCQHDLGHALAALRISAAVLGWQVLVIDYISDAEIAALLGLNRTADFEGAEQESPALFAAILTSSTEVKDDAAISSESIAEVATNADWFGKANSLSKSHVDWPIIDMAEQITKKDRTNVLAAIRRVDVPGAVSATPEPAEDVIQKRRSCLSLDGVTGISRETFYRMLLHTLPGSMPFDALSRSTMQNVRCHLAIFVHRVEGIDKGLYMVVRDAKKIPELQAACDARFLWQKPPGCPDELELFLLMNEDFRKMAAGICCGQAIGGDGAFSLGMICEFEESIHSLGAWYYRRLFWETGFIGQILYLESEAAGVRSTGIGCFFDDPMHETLGFKDRKFQSLYHFTMGGPVEDTRLTTEPAYERQP